MASASECLCSVPPSEGDTEGSPALGEEAAAGRGARCFSGGVSPGASPAGSHPVMRYLESWCFAGTSRGLQLCVFSPGVSDP